MRGSVDCPLCIRTVPAGVRCSGKCTIGDEWINVYRAAPNPVQHRSAALRFVIMLFTVAACCFVVASGIAVVAAWQIEMITRSHRVVLEKMEHVTER